MTIEMVNCLVSVIALIVSIVALVKSGNSEKVANDIQMASLEIEIRRMIEESKNEMKNIAKDISDNPIDKKRFNSAKETYANSVDEACTKYLDRKVDRARFQKTYSDEIRNLVENKEFAELYREPQTKYKATVKVYKEWNDREDQ